MLSSTVTQNADYKHNFADRNHIESIKTFLQFQVAVKAHDFAAAKIFLSKGLFIDKSLEIGGRYSLLRERIDKFDVAAVEFLLQNGANPNAWYWLTPTQNESLIMFLIITSHIVNPKIDKNAFKIFDLLIQHKADVNAKTNKKMTALHFAAKMGSAEWVAKLLSNGAYPNSVNDEGETSLQIALKKESKDQAEILKLLVRSDALIPKKHENLCNLKIDLPNVGTIEYFEERIETFLSNIKDFQKDFKKSKEVIVLFFSQHEHSPSSEYYGAIVQYYSNSFRNLYSSLSENFQVFRVLISSIEDMEKSLAKIKSWLPKDKKIMHMSIFGHSSNTQMAIGRDQRGRLNYLSIDACKNNRALPKVFSHLDSKATIAASGCGSAYGINNLCRALSTVSQQRVVFGTPRTVSNIAYKNVYLGKNRIVIPFFKDSNSKDEQREITENTAGYQDGQHIIAWERKRIDPLRSRL